MKRIALATLAGALAIAAALLARTRGAPSRAALRLDSSAYLFEVGPDGAGFQARPDGSQALHLGRAAIARDGRKVQLGEKFERSGARMLRSIGPDGSSSFAARPDGIEQSWTFDREPRGSRALELHIAASGLPFRRSGPQGLVFQQARGGAVFYGNATWIDADARRTELPVRFTSGEIAVEVPAALLKSSRYPAVLDPTISAELPADAPVCAPAAAQESSVHATFDGTNYLLVWKDGSESLVGTRVAPDGTTLDCGSLKVGSTQGNGPVTPAAVASNGTRSLAIWSSDNVTGSGYHGNVTTAWIDADGTVEGGPLYQSYLNYAISFSIAAGNGAFLAVWDYGNGMKGYGNYTYAVLVDANGQASAPFQIYTGSSEQFAPTVTFDGTNFLVAWTEETNSPYSIVGVRIATDGTVLDSTPRLLAQTGSFVGNPLLSSDGAGSLLVWDGNFNIQGERIDASGSVLDASPLTLGPSNNAKSLGFDGTNYVLAWSHNQTGTQYYGERISAAGAVLDASPLPLASDSNGVSTDFALAVGGSGWMLDWQSGSEIYGVTANTSGTVAGSAVLYSQIPNGESAPSVAFDGTNYFAVWTDTRGGGSHICGARFDSTGKILDDPAIAITSGSATDNDARVAFDGSKFQVAYSTTVGAQAPTVALKSVAPDGTVLPGQVAVCSSSCGSPAIAATPAESMVVWAGISGAHVQGVRLAPDGGHLDAAPLTLSSGSSESNPSIATDGTGFGVVWVDDRNDSSTGFDIYGTRVAADGTVLDPAGLPVGKQSLTDIDPNVAFGGGQYLTAWSGYQSFSGTAPVVFAASFSADGGALSPWAVQNPSAPGRQYAPALAFDGNHFDAVWEDFRNQSAGDIYGSRILATGSLANFVDRTSIGVSVLSPTRTQYAPAIAHGAGDQVLIAYAREGILGTTPRLRVRTAVFNDAPVAQSQTVFTPTGTAVAITLQATDKDQDALSWNIASGPSNGALSGTAPQLTYTPNSGFSGTDSFTFTANDGTSDSNVATVTIGVDNPPVANAQSVSVPGNTSANLTLTASDADGDPLTWTVVSSPSYGRLTGTAPQLTYSPNFGFTGTDSFTFKVNDGHFDSNVATVTLNVARADQPPTATSMNVSVLQGQSVPITLLGSDPENDALTFRVLDQPDAGSLSGTAPSLTYTPPSGFRGATGFDYVANDGQLDSAPATVSITVENAAPTVSAAANPTAAAVGQSVAFTATGSDPGGDPLTYDWDFGDGSAHASGAQVSHAFASAGTFTATVSCFDGLATATARVELVVGGGSSGSTGGASTSGSTGASTGSTGTGAGSTGTGAGSTGTGGSGAGSAGGSTGGTGGNTSGCGCTSSGGGGLELTWLLGLIGLARRRRGSKR